MRSSRGWNRPPAALTKLEAIDARRAFFISGSDVLGPMGGELIPVSLEAQAKTFLEDHKGKTLLKFGEITLEIVNSLD